MKQCISLLISVKKSVSFKMETMPSLHYLESLVWHKKEKVDCHPLSLIGQKWMMQFMIRQELCCSWSV